MSVKTGPAATTDAAAYRAAPATRLYPEEVRGLCFSSITACTTVTIRRGVVPERGRAPEGESQSHGHWDFLSEVR